MESNEEKRKRGYRIARDAKLASKTRDKVSRGTRPRRRPNGGSLSSRGSATSMQCGLCSVVAGLFRRAMCIAGSRRGSGESCYQELTSDVPPPSTRVQPTTIIAVTTNTTTETCLKSSSFTEMVKEIVHEVRIFHSVKKIYSFFR